VHNPMAQPVNENLMVDLGLIPTINDGENKDLFLQSSFLWAKINLTKLD
jgi:hypothetical protein